MSCSISYDTKTEVTYDRGLSSQQLEDAINYINANLAQPLLVNAIAKRLTLSRFHFSRQFKKSTGLSPRQYIIQQRVLKAKLLLQENKLCIADIAFACGFTDQSHFSNQFKRLTGVTPRKFQKTYKT